ncbi:outer membrane protein assembly factor BamB family protein [Cellulomonas xiejunii]|uniref:PQQ-like beta-propeller repeat protein n=1 Tax=Cellulomonas xiejunii TaxID=2968083 RepID=A0ABY5KQA5_9CELL|nr:PQQ-binding-like beta-propeller repeat protein [Cellulomonas xiejunii]MCC2321388.1 PQQ-like beta-propeller repeat protein [Cellulomonas xiejunii]UUI71970.1 PQQ-like beta-propeller repeat protein [Cellulomonas xiejunii]
MARHSARTHVELVEDDGVDGVAPPPDGQPRTTPDGPRPTDHAHPSPRTRRRVLTVAATLVVALVVVATVGEVREAAKERARLAGFAALPQALSPLDAPPEELWTGDTDGLLLQTTVRTAGGLLVGAHAGDDGSSIARALDPATGEVVWEQELLAASDAPPDPGVFAQSGSCLAHGADVPLVACLASDAVAVYDDDDVRYVPATVTRLLLLDPQDGTVVADLSDAVAGMGSAPAFLVLGDLAVVSSVVDGATEVVAAAPDGTVAWRTTVPAPVLPESSARDGGPRAQVTPLGDHLLVATAVELRVLDATGATLRTVTLGSDEFLEGTSGATALVSTAGDRVPVMQFSGSVGEGETSKVLWDDHVGEVPGRWLRPQLDDGSADGLVLTVDHESIHAWDPDGALRWRADRPSSISALTVLAGRVHLTVGGGLVTLDARTGAELWRRDRLVVADAVLTDGRHLLVRTAAPADAPQAELVALDATDGTVAWRTQLPPGVDSLWAVGGLLVGVSSGEEGTWEVTVLG